MQQRVQYLRETSNMNEINGDLVTSDDAEDTTIGGVTWHCSEEDGGPDVGISLYLGPKEHIWCGEMSNTLFEELGGKEHFDSDGGWFVVHYNPEPTLIAKCAERHEAQSFIEMIGSWARLLKPFAAAAKEFEGYPDSHPLGADPCMDPGCLNVGLLRRAEAVLTSAYAPNE